MLNEARRYASKRIFHVEIEARLSTDSPGHALAAGSDATRVVVAREGRAV
ncbi:hypothetical protein Arub01_38040 [Actinomadura rubrobrunea]|uniref:Uncharacterized protein n=2 Tax=Actinomadura rubrobrunea TaxID=115335 RepID=A0A9W6PW79_9ACTN|nr:hypothetical protein Arub01_38040 [Actinomadura rubrobrunea]